MAPPRPQGPTCQACRLRHLACDRVVPTCGRCRAARRPCTQRFTVRFSKRRAWAPPAKSPSSTHSSPGSSKIASPETGNVDLNAQPESIQSQSPWSLEPQSSAIQSSPPAPPTSQSPSDLQDNISRHASDETQYIFNEQLSSSPLVLTAEDASLFQYFGDSVGRQWFDHTHPDFTIEALRYARCRPVLCYSILALSSFYHGMTTGESDGRSDMLHQKAVAMLLTLMRDPTRLADGTGLASVVILRLHEESKARQDGLDTESHLLAGHIFAATISSHEQQPATKLAHAAFWVHQRQDVFSSIIQQKPTRTRLDEFDLWEPGDPSDIFTWTRRAQKLAGETANFCFGGDEAQPRGKSFAQLQQDLDAWVDQTSPAFQPLVFLKRDLVVGRVLPEIRFAANTYLTGYVHYRLSKLLLAMYNPNSLTLGPNAIHWHKQMEIEVQDHVRVLCGIARHNACPIGKVIACLAISLGHGWFHDSADKSELLAVLSLCKQENALANYALEQNLRLAWSSDNPSPTVSPMSPPATAFVD